MAKMSERDYYTVAQAAEILEVSTVTVWRWIKADLLPAYRAGPKNIRIKKEDLQSVLSPARRSAQVLPDTEEVIALKESTPISTTFTIRPLTGDEAREQAEAVQASEAFLQHLRAKHSGTRMSSSVPIIRQAREERSQELL